MENERVTTFRKMTTFRFSINEYSHTHSMVEPIDEPYLPDEPNRLQREIHYEALVSDLLKLTANRLNNSHGARARI
jgi:hypothetical protein